MKISLVWLKDYIDIEEAPEDLGALLTDTGLEVEKIEEYSTQTARLDGLLIGEVKECIPHPDADRLKVTQVDLGDGNLYQIVCGAPNVAVGQKVVVAPVNTTLYPAGGEPFKIKKAKMRGQESNGMICAADEIGLGDDHSGVLVLDTQLPNGAPAAEYFKGYTDTVLEIGLTPNRGDAASHIGVARDIKAVTGRDVQFPTVEGFRKEKSGFPIDVIVEDEAGCPRYSWVLLDNVKVGESPEWLKDRLSAIGVNSINNVVDITNFVLHETGQPLHAFDADKIKGGKVVVKTLEEGSAFVTLDDVERKLKSTDLMICNAEEGMCIAGVFGGKKSGVTTETSRIFLESAYFSPDYIRKTSQVHGLKTDAAFRFERGCDPEMTIYAAKRAAILMKEITGATIVSEVGDIYPKPITPRRVNIKYKNVDRLMGVALPRETMHGILTRLDIKVEEITEAGFVAEVPAYRSDVTREADVIEEITRIYGINNIPIPEHLGSEFLSEFPAVDRSDIQRDLTGMLTGNGFFETITNSLVNPAHARLIDSLPETQDVVILNRLSEELGVMRQTMMFNLLEVIGYNLSHRQKTLKFFEFGKTYARVDGKYKEREWLALAIAGDFVSGNWNEKTAKAGFFDLSAMVNRVIDRVFGGNVETEVERRDGFDYALSYNLNTRPTAHVGKVSSKIARKFGIKGDVFYAEIALDQLLKGYKAEVSLEAVSKFPEVERDLSLVLDRQISFKEVERVARRSGGFLMRKLSVFDVYEGDKIPEDKKAYALTFTLQDREKTLSDKDIDKCMNRLMESFKKELGAIIRE